MKRMLAAFCAVCLVSATAVRGGDRVVALVGKRPIFESDLRQRIWTG